MKTDSLVLGILTNFGIIIKSIAQKEQLAYEGENQIEKHLWNMICGDMKRGAIEDRIRQFSRMKKKRTVIYIWKRKIR